MPEQQRGPHSAWRLAARYGDADAEEHGLAECFHRQGIELEEVQHVADQRALRVILLRRGLSPATFDHLRAFELTPAETQAKRELTAVYMDALYIGWRARGLAEGMARHAPAQGT